MNVTSNAIFWPRFYAFGRNATTVPITYEALKLIRDDYKFLTNVAAAKAPGIQMPTKVLYNDVVTQLRAAGYIVGGALAGPDPPPEFNIIPGDVFA